MSPTSCHDRFWLILRCYGGAAVFAPIWAGISRIKLLLLPQSFWVKLRACILGISNYSVRCIWTVHIAVRGELRGPKHLVWMFGCSPLPRLNGPQQQQK
jgi:hypothetical protein